MPDRRPPSYPPVGEPDRFDQIVARGRSLRRRRQLGVGIGTGGTVVALVALIALVTGGSPTTERIVVDQADDATTTTALTTTTVPTAAAAVMTVTVTQDSPPVITVDDPAQAIGADARQCVLVTLDDGASAGALAEGYACSEPGPDGPGVPSLTAVEVMPTDGVEIGCAASATRQDPTSVTTTTTSTRRSTSTFEVLTPGVPPGTYTIVVSATSGIGDGCATGDVDPNEQEASAGTTATLSLP